VSHLLPCSTDLLALPTCDPDKTFAVQISHEETMLQTPVAFVQCALLHTSSNGERRIRCAVGFGAKMSSKKLGNTYV
jgi:protein transport protein SEC24